MIDASTCALRAAQTLRAAEDSPDSERAMALVAVADAWTRLVGTLALHSVAVFGTSPEPTDEEQLGPVVSSDTSGLEPPPADDSWLTMEDARGRPVETP